MVKNKKILLVLMGILFSLAANAVPNRYVVYLKDKENSPYINSNPIHFLSQDAIDRRDGVIIEEDYPVNPAYITEIRKHAVRYLFQSRWFNWVMIEAESSEIAGIEALPFVETVTLVATGANPGKQEDKLNVLGSDENGIATSFQNEMINADFMHHVDGFGRGVKLAVIDAGFIGLNSIEGFRHIRDNNLIKETYNFVYKTENVDGYHDHGTRVMSTVSGITSNFQGVAPETSLFLYVSEDVNSEMKVEEYYWLLAAEKADSAGVDVITSSLGYYEYQISGQSYTQADMDGKTAVITLAAEKAFEKGIVVVSSAGNEANTSWGTITAPADGHNVLAIGAIDPDGSRSSFSSIGPSADNRIKPDVVALGSNVASLYGSGGIGPSRGTSLSAPQVAGIICGLLELFPDMNNQDVNELIRSTASQASNPDNDLGYGIVKFGNLYALLKEVEQEENIAIYPNPLIEEELKISVQNPFEENNLMLLLYSSEGKQISVQEVTIGWKNNPLSVNFNGLSKGMYVLHIVIKNDIIKTKVVKQ